MVYNNYYSIKGLKGAYEALKEMPPEFTSAEYNKARCKGSSTIQRLREAQVIKVVRVESFEKEVYVPVWRRGRIERVLVTDDGSPVSITEYDYRHSSVPIKMAIDLAFNNGHPLRVLDKKTEDTEVILCKKYYYTVDTQAFDRLFEREKKQFKRVVERKRKLLDKATNVYNKVANLYEAL